MIFYFSTQNTIDGNEICIKLVDEYCKLNKSSIDIYVFVECKFDYDCFISYTKKDKKLNIIVIDLSYEHTRIILNDENKNEILLEYNNVNVSQWSLIDPSLNVNEKEFEDAVCKYLIIFTDFINSNQVTLVHFGFIGGFRSLGIVLLHYVTQVKNILFNTVWSAPIKGRFMLYDNLYFKPTFIENDYRLLLENGITKNIKEYVDKYIFSYLEFKNKIHAPLLKNSVTKKSKHSLERFKYFIYQSLISMCCNKRYGKVKNIIPNNPYVLLLLNKPNNWLSNFAQPFFGDFSYIAKVISISLPVGYMLVIKDHPLICNQVIERIQLYEMSKNNNNVHYLNGNADGETLVDNASVVITCCSTSGVEALFKFKNVVALGQRPVFFDFQNPPVYKLSNIEDLPKAINDCISDPPPFDKIYAYLYCMLHHSVNCYEDKRYTQINHSLMGLDTVLQRAKFLHESIINEPLKKSSSAH